MDENARAQLKHVFEDYALVVESAANDRVSREAESGRLHSAFQRAFEAHLNDVVLPLFEEIGAEVRKSGHGCTVTRATHGTFFSGPEMATGGIFMFYPGSVLEEHYALRPGSAYVAVFEDPSRLKARLYAKAVSPGGFVPGQPPRVVPLEDLTPELLTTTCIDVIRETLRRMES